MSTMSQTIHTALVSERDAFCDHCGKRNDICECSRNVVRPKYYQAEINGKAVQVLDVVEMYYFPPHLFDAMIYLMRAGKKPGQSELEDLEKAHFFVKRWIEKANCYYADSDPYYGEARLPACWYPPLETLSAFGITGKTAIACERLMMLHLESVRPIQDKVAALALKSVWDAVEDCRARTDPGRSDDGQGQEQGPEVTTAV
jgi:hypothetical protein